MTTRRLLKIALAGTGLALVPGSIALALTGEDPTATVEVRMTESAIAVSETSVRAGRVAVRTRNAGRQEHELLIVATDLAPDRIPIGLDGPAVQLAGRVVFGKPHSHSQSHASARPGVYDHLLAGHSRRDEMELAPGRYVLLCTLPGHYQAGQRAGLLVTP